MVQPITTSESQLFIHNLATGETKEVSEPGKPGMYMASGFTNDNAWFFYTTDAGREFSYLMRYSPATGERELLYETSWDVTGSWLSRNERPPAHRNQRGWPDTGKHH